MAPEIVTWKFYEDGTYRRRFVADFSEEETGAWSILPATASQGAIFLADKTGDQHTATGLHVLSFVIEDESLVLGENVHESIKFEQSDSPPAISPAERSAVAEETRKQTFSLWADICAQAWQISTEPAPGDPSTYRFLDDGTYMTNYAATHCGYEGTWSMFNTGPQAGNGPSTSEPRRRA